MNEFDFDLPQVAQMHEIQKALARRDLPGLGRPMQTFIEQQRNRLADVRLDPAHRLWRSGWGKLAGYDHFEDYLRSVPMPPEFPEEWKRVLPLLVLVDTRVTESVACTSTGIAGQCRPYYGPRGRRRPSGPYWIRCHDGRGLKETASPIAKAGWPEWRTGLTVLEAVTLVLNQPSLKGCTTKLLCIDSRGHRDGIEYSIPYIGLGPQLKIDCESETGIVGLTPSCAFIDDPTQGEGHI